MNTANRWGWVLFGLLAIINLGGQTSGQVNVTTYHNDNLRSGANSAETILNSGNVSNLFQFERLFQVNVDGQIYAQPLVLSNVSIGGGTHNVVYVATENDSLYAIDATTGAIYWSQNFVPAGYTPSDDYCDPGNPNISGGIGITGTPVIDTATNTIYFVTSTKLSGVGYYQELHAVDAATGVEKFGGPVLVTGSYGGVAFNAEKQLQRPALLLVDGHIVVAFGQHCSDTAYGWVMSYSKSTLALEAIFNTNPGTTNGSVWMSGDGVAADSSGNLYFAVGDAKYDGSSLFGDTIVKLGLPSNGVFPLLDWFTPNTAGEENTNDWDQGSGGVLILPDLSSGSHPHLLVQAGKTGTIYLIDRTNMGKYCGSPTCSDKDVEEILGSNSMIGGSSTNLAGVWGSPAYWNGYVYFPSANKETGLGGNVADYVKAYSFNAGGSGLLSSQPAAQTAEAFAWPGPNPSVSANGSTSGIVWLIDSNYTSSPAVLHAYDATTLTEWYNSAMLPGRDGLGEGVKFSVPTIANGMVYVGGRSTLSAFGISPITCSVTSEQCIAPTVQNHERVTAKITLSCNTSSSISVTADACVVTPPNWNSPACTRQTNSTSGTTVSISSTSSQPVGSGQSWECGFGYCYNGACQTPNP